MLSLVSFAGAQVTEKKTLTLQGAERVISAAKAEAQRLQAPGGVIAVVDDGGNLMALERLDGTFSAGANISIGKAKTAVMFEKPTRFFEELINSSGKGRTVMTALENFTPLMGGIPITLEGQIVGGVGVSGAATADQDEQLAIAGSKAFETRAMNTDPSPGVSYWEKSQVDEAFSKGAVLFDGSNGRNYMVHASRREKPGQAEIHTKDADVIYVLQGSATFITGGEAVEAKNIAPDELRGTSIKGGETRKIAKGDVIIVPHGVPHQFLEVTNPFLYYVVKVRSARNAMNRLSLSLSLILLASLVRVGAQTIQDPPVGRPDAVIDLASREGVQLVNGQWRYHDVKIVYADSRAVGPDLKPSGAPIRTYDYAPHAGGADFDDS